MVQIVLVAILRTAIWLHEIFPLVFLILLIPRAEWNLKNRYSLYLMFHGVASYLLDGVRILGIDSGLFNSIFPYVLVCYNFWHLFEADESLQEFSLVAEKSIFEWSFSYGLRTVAVFCSSYCLIPLVSILLPRSTPFLWRHRLIICAAATGSLFHWAPDVYMDPLMTVGGIWVVVMSARAEGRSPRVT